VHYSVEEINEKFGSTELSGDKETACRMAFVIFNLSEQGRNNFGRIGGVISLLLVILGW
jgi:hypothetical protein